MNYPYTVGFGKVDEENKPYWNEEIREYLIITADEDQNCYSSTTNGIQSNYHTSRTVLGHIDLTTGERYSGKDAVMWEMTAEEHDTERYKNLFRGGVIYRIRAAMQKKNVVLYPIEILGEADSEPFLEQLYAAYVEERDRPVFLHTDLFGDLPLNKRYNSFEGTFEYEGQKIEFSIDNGPDAARTVSRLEAFVRDFDSHDKQMRRFAAAKLTSLANKWADEEGDPHITEEQFFSLLVPEGIEMRGSGKYFMYYTDGGVFGGHSVEVCGNSKGPAKAQITG
ncbi:MAG: DUF2262 domain-containing protein [Ruminococcus sp.]|nr:DUF2262 domain-containing protein [Ruminococcus sp.]